MSEIQTVQIGLWCSDCFAFLEHTLVLKNVTAEHATYNKHCSQCKTETGPITVVISLWEEISQNQTKEA